MRAADELFFEAHVGGFHAQLAHPVFDDLLVLVVKDAGANKFRLVRDAEAVTGCGFVWLNLVYVHPSQKQKCRRKLLIFVIIDVECLISQHIKPCPHRSSFSANFQKFSAFDNF